MLAQDFWKCICLYKRFCCNRFAQLVRIYTVLVNHEAKAWALLLNPMLLLTSP